MRRVILTLNIIDIAGAPLALDLAGDGIDYSLFENLITLDFGIEMVRVSRLLG